MCHFDEHETFFIEVKQREMETAESYRALAIGHYWSYYSVIFSNLYNFHEFHWILGNVFVVSYDTPTYIFAEYENHKDKLLAILRPWCDARFPNFKCNIH